MEKSQSGNTIVFNSRDVLTLLTALVCLSLLCLFATVLVDHFGLQSKLVMPFNMHNESTVPTWVHSAILFLNFLLGTSIYRIHIHKSDNRYFKASWIFLTTLFLYISIDESSTVHEWVGTLYNEISRSGYLNLPVGYFLTAFAPFILASILLMMYLFFSIFKSGYIKESLLAVCALSFWVLSIIVEKIDGIYKQSAAFTESGRYVIRYVTEYFELFGTAVFTLFLLKYLSSLNKHR